MVNSSLVDDPTIRQPRFDLPRCYWALLNRFRTNQGHCASCRTKWDLAAIDVCPCGKCQTMSHIVNSCPQSKLEGGCSDYTQLMTFLLNGRRHTPRIWTQQQPPPHHNHVMALFPGPPGWASARRELLDFMVQGKINRGRHTDHPDGRYSIRTKQCPPPSFPIFYRSDALPVAQPTVSKHWRQLDNNNNNIIYMQEIQTVAILNWGVQASTGSPVIIVIRHRLLECRMPLFTQGIFG